MSNVVTRFAPSPTGYLHVGGARTALYSWLLARHHGGRFLLRIEDTDLGRSTQTACDQLLEDLGWLGLDRDNADLVFQSRRTEIYNHLLAELIAKGAAYEAWETPAELAALRAEAEAKKQSFTYRRRDHTADEIARFKSESRTPVIRLVMPVREYRFHDEVLDKEIVLPAAEAQDLVIRKTDGMPTYHFAVVVDDAQMGITHVLRGQEHLKNTFYHLAIQEALGYTSPTYGHLPIIMNVDGSKMGKRDRDKKVRQATQVWMKSHQKTPADLAAAAGLAETAITGWLAADTRQLDLPEQKAVMAAVGLAEGELPEVLVHDFRRNGYLPEALLNFMALCGWNPGDNREQMSIPEMVQAFRISDIGKSNARFNRDKLLAFNTDACAAASPDRLLAGFRDYLSANPESPVNAADDATLLRLLEMKKGFRRLRDVDEPARFLFVPDDQIAFDPAAVQKVLLKNDSEGLKLLAAAGRALADVRSWTAQSLEEAVKTVCDARGVGLGKVAQPIRVAVTGTAVSPPIFESLELLGQRRTQARILNCLAAVTPAGGRHEPPAE